MLGSRFGGRRSLCRCCSRLSSRRSLGSGGSGGRLGFSGLRLGLGFGLGSRGGLRRRSLRRIGRSCSRLGFGLSFGLGSSIRRSDSLGRISSGRLGFSLGGSIRRSSSLSRISRNCGGTRRMRAEIAVIDRTNAVTSPERNESLISGSVTVMNTLKLSAPMS